MKKTNMGFAAIVATLAMGTSANVAFAEHYEDFLEIGPGDLWQVPPYDFVFGNHMDTHIQLKLKTRWNGTPKYLYGYFYVYFTGETDPKSGLPIAKHPRGESHDERCGIDEIICIAGWKLVGRPGAAKFLYHSGVNQMDHPVWLVNRAEEPNAPAAGMVIPQPGYYSHFHWLSSGSTDPRAEFVPDWCDKMSAGMLETMAPSAVNQICEGWFLKLKALRSFAFKHGAETIIIRKGADLRSHLNIVTNYKPDLSIDSTRPKEPMGMSH